MIITGIGSRKTPFDVYYRFEDYILRMMDMFGRTDMLIRSGGADGADSYFESIARKYDIPMDVYLPWNGFNEQWENNLKIDVSHINYIVLKTTFQLEKLAEHYHPNWTGLSDGAKLLHMRNVLQILGEELTKPSHVVVCWCPLQNNKPIGGTGQALRIANNYGIPVLNFWETQ